MTPHPFVPIGKLFLPLLLLGMMALNLCIAPRPTQAEPASVVHGEQSLLQISLDLGAARRWRRDDVADEQPKWSKPLLVLHLFSLDCIPCLQELPLLKEVFRAGLPDIDFALLLETLDVPRIREFLHQNGGILPMVPVYLNTDGRLRGPSQLGIGTVPLTLLLDQNLIVRQAFIGTLRGRMHELTEGLHGLLTALKHQPQPLAAALADGVPVESTKLLHRWVNLSVAEKSWGRRDTGHHNPQHSASLHLLYLFGSSCNECSEELDGGLRRMSRDWSRTKGVRFSILNCGAAASTPAASSTYASLSGRIFHPCNDRQLQEVWTRAQRPVILLVDSRQVVRDAFIGPINGSVRIAVRRLLAEPR